MNTPLFDILLQSMRDRFPQLSWKLGSVLRTLILEPLVDLSDEISKFTDKLAVQSDVESLLQDPIVYEAEITQWLDRLGVTLPEPRESTGTITITRTVDEPLAIDAGTSFTWGDDIRVYASELSMWGESGQAYREIAPGVYSLEIPVTTANGQVTFLRTGSPLNWETAPADILDIYVQSPVGGGMVITPNIKANMLKAALTSPTMCGIDNIRAALFKQYDGAVCDAQLGDKRTISGRCELPLYLKQSSPPAEFRTKVDPSNIKIIDGMLVFHIDMSTSVELLEVSTETGVVVVADDINYIGTAGSPGAYAELYSSQFSNPAEILRNTTFYSRLKSFSVANAAISWLNEAQRGLPYSISPKLPAYGFVKLQINCGVPTLPTEAKVAICSYINNSKLNESLNDSVISAILDKYNITLTGSSLYIAAMVHAGSTVTVTQPGGLSVYGRFGLDGTPVALYCTVTDIESY